MPKKTAALNEDQLPQRRFRTPLALLLDRFESYAVVIDSSIVIEDIRWKVLKRTNPAARSLLDRALDSTLLRPYVPDVLEGQVEENLQELAERHRIPVERFRAEWDHVRPRLQIVPVAEEMRAAVQIRDVTDADFVAAQQQTQALVIVSKDKDILESAAPSADRVALEQTTVLYAAILASMGAAVWFGLVSLSPLILLGLAGWAIFKFVKRSPLVALIALAATVFLAWIFWDKIRVAFKKLFSPETKEAAFEFVGMLAVTATEYRKKSEEAKAALESTLGLPAVKKAVEPEVV